MDYEYQCNHCDYMFNVKQEDVRTKSNVIMPEGRNTDVNVSYLPEPDNLIPKPTELKGTFKVLKEKGLKITNSKGSYLRILYSRHTYY